VDAQSRVVYVGNLSFEVDEEVLRGAFPELGIETITWGCADPADPATFKGYAHVCFTTHDHAAAATRSNGADLLGRPMRIAFEVPRRRPRTQAEDDAAAAAASAARPEGATRAYVTGLPYDAEPAAAEAALTAALPGIQRVKLGFDATSGAFRGYAHLEFGTTGELDAAVGAARTVVLGRQVTITYAKEKAMPPRGPGVSRKKGALPPRETATRGDNKRQRR
jgi:RNA recognition motif-containing protein